MPTNLPPEYYEAEQNYRAAKTIQEKITTLEELISTIPKHKGTDKLRADFRRRLSKLKESSQAKKKVSRQSSAFYIDKEGAGQAILVGPTNVGKSALLTALTNATPEVSEAPFTTWVPTPGMMPIENIQVQLVDTPPLNPEFVEPLLFELIRRTDLILLVVDVQTNPVQQLEDSIAILEEHRIIPLHLKGQHPEEGRLAFIPTLILANKTDDQEMDELFQIFCELTEGDWSSLPVSATHQRNFDQLKSAVFERLNIIRIYSKAPGKEPDLEAPFVMKKGSTIEEFASKVHQDFIENLKAARVWGYGVFDGQLVSRDHVLHDEDIVELRT
ncbi:MAG: GTPase [Chloroflexota bacterium]